MSGWVLPLPSFPIEQVNMIRIEEHTQGPRMETSWCPESSDFLSVLQDPLLGSPHAPGLIPTGASVSALSYWVIFPGSYLWLYLITGLIIPWSRMPQPEKSQPAPVWAAIHCSACRRRQRPVMSSRTRALSMARPPSAQLLLQEARMLQQLEVWWAHLPASEGEQLFTWWWCCCCCCFELRKS